MNELLTFWGEHYYVVIFTILALGLVIEAIVSAAKGKN